MRDLTLWKPHASVTALGPVVDLDQVPRRTRSSASKSSSEAVVGRCGTARDTELSPSGVVATLRDPEWPVPDLCAYLRADMERDVAGGRCRKELVSGARVRITHINVGGNRRAKVAEQMWVSRADVRLRVGDRTTGVSYWIPLFDDFGIGAVS